MGPSPGSEATAKALGFILQILSAMYMPIVPPARL